MVLVDLLHKLVFGHSFFGVIYMPALILESSDSLWADIFEEEEFEVLVIHGVEDFWLTDVHAGATAPAPERFVKNRGFWRDGNGDSGGRGGGRHFKRHFELMGVLEKF